MLRELQLGRVHLLKTSISVAQNRPGLYRPDHYTPQNPQDISYEP